MTTESALPDEVFVIVARDYRDAFLDLRTAKVIAGGINGAGIYRHVPASHLAEVQGRLEACERGSRGHFEQAMKNGAAAHAAEARVLALERALRELVELKAARDVIDESDDDDVRRGLSLDYLKRKPLAWEAARAALRQSGSEG